MVTLDLFTRFLSLEGDAVVGVAHADEAVAVVSERPPDAILLDLHLPLTDGVACLRRIRHVALHPIPVAIVTGDYSLDASQVAEIEALGGRASRNKPLWCAELLDFVPALFDAPA